MHRSAIDVLSFQCLEKNKKYELKTMSKEYIIYEGKIQEVQNRLQNVCDYN
jgi:hypothetical protein